jgi:hypothetical protein
LASDRWKQIETLYHAALERPRAERSGFLEAACGEDLTLRAEVESLLEQDSRPDFLDKPLVPRFAAGVRLGHYEILSMLGKGGMGEVWRARDMTLGREVAIKTLPEAFARDADRIVVTGFVVWRLKPPDSLPVKRSSILFDEDQTAPRARGVREVSDVAISHDDARIAYVANGRLYVRNQEEWVGRRNLAPIRAA